MNTGKPTGLKSTAVPVSSSSTGHSGKSSSTVKLTLPSAGIFSQITVSRSSPSPMQLEKYLKWTVSVNAFVSISILESMRANSFSISSTIFDESRASWATYADLKCDATSSHHDVYLNVYIGSLHWWSNEKHLPSYRKNDCSRNRCFGVSCSNLCDRWKIHCCHFSVIAISVQVTTVMLNWS